MSKVLEATCNATSIVTADGKTVSIAEILSMGKQASSGILIMQGGKCWYITSNASDIETTLTKMNSALTKIATILTSIGAGMTGATTAPPPTLGTAVAEINAIAAELNTLKAALK